MGRVSRRQPYFRREISARGPLQFIVATWASMISPVFARTAKLTESGFNRVCSNVSISSKWARLVLISPVVMRRSCSLRAKAAANRNLRTTVLRLMPSTMAIRRWVIADA
jgi:hypothetical protein